MTLKYTKDNNVSFECNGCGDRLDTDKNRNDEFHEAMNDLRTEGWKARKNEHNGNWEHWCPACR